MKTEVYGRRHLKYPKEISNKYFVFRKGTRFILCVYDSCELLIISKINVQFLKFFENLELERSHLLYVFLIYSFLLCYQNATNNGIISFHSFRIVKKKNKPLSMGFTLTNIMKVMWILWPVVLKEYLQSYTRSSS